jgi:macrolide-specific efflux system membrane fusion protein
VTTPNLPRRRFRRLWWLLLPLLVFGGFRVWRRAHGASSETIDKALLAKVKRAELEVVVLETGRVEPRLQTQVKSKVGGQVIEVAVEEGAKVKKGQLLLRIDPADYRRDVARMEAEIAQSREMLAFSELQLRRTEKAHGAAIAAAAELDQSQHEAVMAHARLRSAEVALATARDRLRYADIEAPFEGTVIQRNVQPGEVVVPGMTATVEGKPLLVLADMSVLLVKIDLNQIDVARVRLGQKAELLLDALPGKKFAATVTRVAAAAATTVRSNGATGPDAFPVEASLDTSQDLSQIKPGMTADVRILIEKKPQVLVLPIEALVVEKGKSWAQLVERGAGGRDPKTNRREVTVGARNDRELEVAGGLAEGDEVLIKPPAANEVKM